VNNGEGLLKTAGSHPDTTKTFVVAAALSLAALPVVQEGVVTPHRLFAFLIAALVGLIIVLFFRSPRFDGINGAVSINEAVLGFILASGVVFRLRALLARRSLWFDEVSLATSIRDQSLLDLLTTPLPYQQSAASGFLAASWLTFEAFGTGLVWVRVVPFVAGVMTLVLGLLVAKSAFNRLPAQAFFMAILALSPVLIFYSSEMKQYSTDALAMTAGLYVAHLIKQRRSALRAAVIGFTAVIFSSAGLIVFFLLALIVVFSGGPGTQFRGVIQAAMRNVAVLLTWLVAAAIHVLYTVKAGVDRTYMQEYWGARGGFAPETFFSSDTATWYGERASELVWLTFDATEMVGPGAYNVSLWVLLATIILVIGGCRHAGLKNEPLLLVFFTLIMAIMLAQLSIFPLSSRLALYLIPAFAFLMASGVDRYVGNDKKGFFCVVNTIAAALLTASLISTALGQFHAPYLGKDMDAALKVLVREGQSGDAIWAIPLDMRIIDWHRTGAHFTAPVLPVNPEAARNPSQIDNLGEMSTSRLWIVSSARRREARMLFQEVEQYFESSAVYSSDDTFIALLSNIGPVEFALTNDRSRLTVKQGLRVND